MNIKLNSLASYLLQIKFIIKANRLHIEATRYAVKSLSCQWLSENLLPNLLATRQVTTDGIN